jgi:hypothetical protein
VPELMLGRCASSTYPKKELIDLLESEVLSGQGAALPSACGANATLTSHLANEFDQTQFVNYYASVTFLQAHKSLKAVDNNLVC